MYFLSYNVSTTKLKAVKLKQIQSNYSQKMDFEWSCFDSFCHHKEVGQDVYNWEYVTDDKNVLTVNDAKYSIFLYYFICYMLNSNCLLLHTYIIGHYNPSVRIIDLVSHTTYVVCFNFIHKWRDLKFKVDSERQIF